MTYQDRCAQSLISYTTLHGDRKYMDNILLSFFSLLGTWSHALPSGAGWFMRHMSVFSWLVWLHSQLSGTPVAKTIKIHTCTELLESQMKQSQSMRKQVIWGIMLHLISKGVQYSSELSWLIDWCPASLHLHLGLTFRSIVANPPGAAHVSEMILNWSPCLYCKQEACPVRFFFYPICYLLS